jgi:hypothetical protein
VPGRPNLGLPGTGDMGTHLTRRPIPSRIAGAVAPSYRCFVRTSGISMASKSPSRDEHVEKSVQLPI